MKIDAAVPTVGSGGGRNVGRGDNKASDVERRDDDAVVAWAHSAKGCVNVSGGKRSRDAKRGDDSAVDGSARTGDGGNNPRGNNDAWIPSVKANGAYDVPIEVTG